MTPNSLSRLSDCFQPGAFAPLSWKFQQEKKGEAMIWRNRLLNGVLASVVALAACGGGGGADGDSDESTVIEEPLPPGTTQPSCTWTLTRAGGTVTGSCLGTLGYDPTRPLSTVEIASSTPSAVGVELMLPQVLTPGSYSFGNSSLLGSVVVTDSTGAYSAYRITGVPTQGTVTYDVLSVDKTGTVLRGRIRAEAVDNPLRPNRAQLTIDFSGLLR